MTVIGYLFGEFVLVLETLLVADSLDEIHCEVFAREVTYFSLEYVGLYQEGMIGNEGFGTAYAEDGIY